MRGGIGPLSRRLGVRDNVVFVTPNTHPNELSVLFLLFFLCIAVVVLAFIALFCISCRAKKTRKTRNEINKQDNNLEEPAEPGERALQPHHVAPGSSPHLQVMSVAVAVAAPVPARLKVPKPMMPKSMTRRDEGLELGKEDDGKRILRRRQYDYYSGDLRALRALHALDALDTPHDHDGHFTGEDSSRIAKRARGVTQKRKMTERLDTRDNGTRLSRFNQSHELRARPSRRVL